MGDEKRDEPTGYQESHHLHYFDSLFLLVYFNLFLNEGQLLYSVLLVSAVRTVLSQPHEYMYPPL